MQYLKLKLAEKIKPTGLPSTQGSLALQMGQSSMVRKDFEVDPDQELTELL